MKSGKLIKINDGVIIKKNSLVEWRQKKYDPNCCHYYITLFDSNTKTYSMYPTSHYIDPSKQADIRNKRAILLNIKGVNGLTTVYKQPRKKDINGQYFNEKFNKYELAGKLTPYQKKKFLRFIKQ